MMELSIFFSTAFLKNFSFFSQFSERVSNTMNIRIPYTEIRLVLTILKHSLQISCIIYLLQKVEVRSITIAGTNRDFVSGYYLKYSDNGEAWTYYKESSPTGMVSFFFTYKHTP